MEMKVDVQILKSEREKRAWTQQHLADVTNLSLRTIQRIEKTGTAGSESALAIASAFNFKPDQLIKTKEGSALSEQNLFWRNAAMAGGVSVVFLPILAIMLLSSENAVGDAEIYRFEGGIRIDDSPRYEFGVELKEDQFYILPVDSRHRLIMETQLADDSSRETRVRLLQNDGNVYNILHSSTRPGPGNSLHSLSYRVCEGKTHYWGPSVESIPDCNESPTNTSLY